MSWEAWGEPDEGPELPEGWWDEDQVSEAQQRIAKLEEEVLRLRKIAAHIPSADYIAAKERSGFGVSVRATGSDGGHKVIDESRAALTHFARGTEVGVDAEDAARYRWLRRNHNADLLAEDVIDEAIQGERHE